MKLAFYSGGFEEENELMDQALIKLVNKANPLVTFIPAASYDSEIEFREFVKQYSKFGIKRFLHFPVDIPFDQTMFHEVMKSDFIHMHGGNTFYFLRSLRRAKLLTELSKYVTNGGVLTGLSAGSIIMTSDIELAAYPEFDRDVNDINLKNLKSLNLVNFLFFPHFKNSKRYIDAFTSYSKQTKKVIYACPDGSGIVVDQNELSFIGPCFVFQNGKKNIIR